MGLVGHPIDNTLLFGRVIDPTADDPDTVAIREVNELIHTDDLVEACVLPLADGVTLARRTSGWPAGSRSSPGRRIAPGDDRPACPGSSRTGVCS
ncbi:hypothetical protein ABZ793_23815 [Micromonospora sp. NPDC047465]|uniref:O-methyltransferase n=1 Tax=Micromonospora sp. NPDC047465 TaxID=3154813 RepID=UPI0033E5D66C